MKPPELLETAVLLGLFVLLGGGYGVLYGLGRLRRRNDLVVAGFASYALQCVVAAVVLWLTPLLLWWKVFVGLSCAAYVAIPPVVWRYLTTLHRLEERAP
jgi:hypothetical protein